MSVKAPTEQDLVRQCLDYLALRGAFCWRQNQGGMKTRRATGRPGFVRFASAAGIADIVGVLPGGRMLACECKRPGKHPEPHQAAFLARVAAAGGLALCVHSWAELEAGLRAAGES